MSPNTSPVFEALPLEVLGNILRQMGSPEDLYSAIRASPTAFRSFCCFREIIIIQVIQAHLPAEIFAEYLGLLHVPKYEDFNYVPEQSEIEFFRQDDFRRRRSELGAWERSRVDAWFSVLHDFFKSHFKNVREAKSRKVQSYSVPQPAEEQKVNYIISMYGTLKRFIRDYQSFARHLISRRPSPLTDLDHSFRRQEAHLPGDWPSLSENEAIRLQRGFLRYELCSRSGAIPMWDTHITQWDESPLETGFDPISDHLQRWEEEEIRCIWTYVHRQYHTLVREVVADFRCDVRRLSKKARHAPEDKVILAPDISNKIDCDFFERWTYNMSCLGLPMLQQFLRSSFDDQRGFLKNTTFILMPKLEESLLLWHENYLGKDWGNSDDVNYNPVVNLPMTGGASRTYKPVIMELAGWEKSANWLKRLDAVETGLKEIGWVFWEDQRRLKYLGWSDSGTEAVDSIKAYVQRLGYREVLNEFEEDKECPEQSMYIMTEDLQEKLSAKYAVGPPAEGGEEFFLNRLRDISDWSSKEASRAFQEICQGMPTGG